MTFARLTPLIETGMTQIYHLVGDDTPAVALLGIDGQREPLDFVMHDYWPSKDNRALALGQAATAEMAIGATAASAGARFGVLWAHVVITRENLDFGDEERLSWRRVQDYPHLDPREVEALLGFAFDIDEGFFVVVNELDHCSTHHRRCAREIRQYESHTIHEPLPGFTLMRTIAINAPVKEYS